MLSRLSTASLQRVVGSSALNQVSMIFNEEASRPSSAPLMVQLFSGEGPSKTRPDSTRVKLGKSAKKFLQDAERPEVVMVHSEQDSCQFWYPRQETAAKYFCAHQSCDLVVHFNQDHKNSESRRFCNKRENSRGCGSYFSILLAAGTVCFPRIIKDGNHEREVWS